MKQKDSGFGNINENSGVATGIMRLCDTDSNGN